MRNKRILIISDFHAPYNHIDSIRFLKALNDHVDPTRVISVGDEIDHHVISFHDSDPDLPFSPSGELEKAIERLSPLYDMFPRMDILESNHGSLVYRRGKHHGLPRTVFKSYREILEAPKGWKWHLDMDIKLPDGNSCYLTHGKSKNGRKLGESLSRCTIQGHFHTELKIEYHANHDGLYWSMIVGCLIDRDSLAYAYARSNLSRQIIGCAAVIDSQPRLFPMVLNKKGRWCGKIY